MAKNQEMVRPWNLSQQRRDFLVRAGIGLIELAHAKQIGPRKAPQAGLDAGDLRSQAVHDAGAPLGGFNLAADVLADLPVQLDRRRVHGLKGALASDLDESHDGLEALLRQGHRRCPRTLRRPAGLGLARHAGLPAVASVVMAKLVVARKPATAPAPE